MVKLRRVHEENVKEEAGADCMVGLGKRIQSSSTLLRSCLLSTLLSPTVPKQRRSEMMTWSLAFPS